MLCQTHLMLCVFSYKRVKLHECIGFIDKVLILVHVLHFIEASKNSIRMDSPSIKTRRKSVSSATDCVMHNTNVTIADKKNIIQYSGQPYSTFKKSLVLRNDKSYDHITIVEQIPSR